ncbi:MAG: serine/threonine protein kinase [Kofleriaceae bacterium]|nr:serine/threonine protein kinase [Kofleriaceae bacterium]
MNPHPSQGTVPARLGDFAIVGTLGEGGSGVVLDARWGHREVALKVLHPALVATPKEREQFLAEARLLSELQHPGVVKVLGVGETPDGRPYLAMEKLHGETLAARLARGPLTLAIALELFDQLADAVAALHARGLIHRDLKPENIVLVAGADGRQHAVLLDFGIAKDLAAPASTTTQDGGVRGTPAYMAPERFFGQAASIATDVYELAVTLFAMLAGRLPWDDCADPEVRLNPISLATVAPGLPAALDVEVRRALSTRAQNRPAGARELRDAVLVAAGRLASAVAAPRTTDAVRPAARPTTRSRCGAPTTRSR